MNSLSLIITFSPTASKRGTEKVLTGICEGLGFFYFHFCIPHFAHHPTEQGQMQNLAIKLALWIHKNLVLSASLSSLSSLLFIILLSSSDCIASHPQISLFIKINLNFQINFLKLFHFKLIF